MTATPVNRRRFLATLAAASALLATGSHLMSSTSITYTAARPLEVGVVLFESFELLDVFGSLEIIGLLGDRARISLLAANEAPVRARGGPRSVVDRRFDEAGAYDLLLVPGGPGTRKEVDNPALIAAIKTLAQATPLVATVCTGSALLARTGLLDGRRATSNKRAFNWVVSQGPAVNWVPEARWVEDGKYATSSGVSAGIDLTLALVSRLFDRDTATGLAQAAEYEWHEDPAKDPFARVHGLVP